MFVNHWILWTSYFIGVCVTWWISMEWGADRCLTARGKAKEAADQQMLPLAVLFAVMWPLVLVILSGWAIVGGIIVLFTLACDLLAERESEQQNHSSPPTGAVETPNEGPFCPRCGRTTRHITAPAERKLESRK